VSTALHRPARPRAHVETECIRAVMKDIARQQDPDAERLHEASLVAWRSGSAQRAVALLKQAIDLAPEVAACHANLAVMLKDIAPVQQRLACYHRAIELEPDNPVYHANLAAVLNSAGHYSDAESAARRSLALAADRMESWHNLGSALAGQKRWDEAAKAYEQALALGLTAAATRLAAATARLEGREFDGAVEHFRCALALEPLLSAQRVAAWHGLGKAYTALGAGREALGALQQGLALDPAHLSMLIDLGNLHKRLSRFDEARDCYRRVLELNPGCVEAIFNLGAVDQTCGRYEAALARYREALALDPALPAGWNNLVACLSYSAAASAGAVREALVEFEQRVALPLREHRPFTNDRDPQRRLKVGYVSADFRAHPVGYLALPLIEGHLRDRIHVTCYFSHHHQRDAWTAKFQAAADEWVEAAGLDDAALAERIRADEIDILVDLAGHSEGNRLLAFARKPAPVQVTWMGYVTTTGMSAMDWRITHADADPPSCDDAYAERLWRLPGAMWCYRPLPGMPAVSPPPCARNGFVTFGSLNRFSKNSPEALDAWADILRRVPDSRLLVCASPGEVAEGLKAFLERMGVAARRVTTFAHTDHAAFWALHGEIDIALDPFPFNGGMTSCESLWLGVPLVSCTGVNGAGNGDSFPARFASRMGVAILNGIGLPELAVATVSAYIDSAVGLAGDRTRLAALRDSLRPRMAASPLMDEERFVREMEAAYRAMWQASCGNGHG